MAIIEDLGITVNVISNGEPLPEFDDPEDANEDAGNKTQTKYCNKYVECVDGTEFTVQYKAERRPNTPSLFKEVASVLHFQMFVDGNRIGGRILSWARVDGVLRVFDGRWQKNKENQTILRRPRFAPVSTVEEANRERIEKDAKLAKDLGTIQVRVSREIETGSCQLTSTEADGPDSFVIAEKALKGREISHGTVLSAPALVTNPPTEFVSTRRTDPHDVVVFVFKYRSRQALQREMIIPRSPTPEANQVAAADLPIAELRRLAQERLDQIERAKAEVKEEGGVNRAVKRERRPKRSLAAAYDLTGDEVTEMPLPKAARQGGGGGANRLPLLDLSDN